MVIMVDSTRLVLGETQLKEDGLGGVHRSSLAIKIFGKRSNLEDLEDGTGLKMGLL